MTARLGFIILSHENLDRTHALAKYLLANDCELAIHIDSRCSSSEVDELRMNFKADDSISIVQKFRTEWGKFNLVKATLDAAKNLLSRNSDISHVTLLSGACLPLRPIKQYKKFLARHPFTDFIESVDLVSHKWVQDGLSEERFDFYFPFSWKSQKTLFDFGTSLQRKMGVKRQPPLGLKPHLGSQWWCLSRQTLQKIINDPNGNSYDRYFRYSWIPDESYFQSMARIHSERLKAQSLTWSKFDADGRPFTVYSDHLDSLESSDCFFIRKAWSKDEALYNNLLAKNRKNIPLSNVDNKKADSLFSKATNLTEPELNCSINTGRYPKSGTIGRDKAKYPYTVIFGAQFLFENLDNWIANHSNAQCHSDLFDRQKIKISGGNVVDAGNLPMNKLIRNNAPKNFLHNFIANASSQKQVLFFDSLDSRKSFEPVLRDRNATIFFVKNAWISAFAELAGTGEDVYSKAANLQRAEQIIGAQFDRYKCKAIIRNFELSAVLNDPCPLLHELFENLNGKTTNALIAPNMISSSNIKKTIERLKNDGFALDVDAGSLAGQKSNEKQSNRPRLVK